MRQFVSFIIKEAKHILRDRRTMLILFGLPVVLMLLFGFAITNDVKDVRTVIVTSQMDHQTRQAVDRLAASEYFIITATVSSPGEAGCCCVISVPTLPLCLVRTSLPRRVGCS